MHVRVAPACLAGRLIATLIVCALPAACTRGGGASQRVELVWSVQPSRPSLSTETVVAVTIRDQQGHTVPGARLRLQAQMAHPGMAPVLADFVERGDGVYETKLSLSMAGDWVFVVTGELPDGNRVTGSRDVRAEDAAKS
jgi:hypothetical protein